MSSTGRLNAINALTRYPSNDRPISSHTRSKTIHLGEHARAHNQSLGSQAAVSSPQPKPTAIAEASERNRNLGRLLASA